VLNERETNAQLFLELREVYKEKWAKPSKEIIKGHEDPNAKSFHKKKYKGKEG